MKSLLEFIKIKSINNELLMPKNFYNHFFIEFEFNGCKDFICERYGKYDGQIDLVLSLVDNIYNERDTEKSLTFTIKDSEISDFPGIFYHELNIIFDPNTRKTAYIPKENNFDNQENKLNTVDIVISAQTNYNKSRLTKSIMHELTHAWNDYNSYIKRGKSLISLAQTSNYNTIRNSIPNTSAESLCKSILYLTTKFERNAYLSEIYSELDSYEGKIVSWKDAEECFKNSSTYKSIVNIKQQLDSIYKHNSKFINDFVDFYNKYNNTNLTLNKIIKRLNDKLEKLFDKMSKTCAKIYYEWTQKQEINEYLLDNYLLYE